MLVAAAYYSIDNRNTSKQGFAESLKQGMAKFEVKIVLLLGVVMSHSLPKVIDFTPVARVLQNPVTHSLKLIVTVT